MSKKAPSGTRPYKVTFNEAAHRDQFVADYADRIVSSFNRRTMPIAIANLAGDELETVAARYHAVVTPEVKFDLD